MTFTMVQPREGVTLYTGDALTVLRGIPSETVHMCMTSPAYWGLRSYLPTDDPSKALELGMEATPELYVEHLVAVFREVRRVLRPEGTLWLVLGDSYASGSGGRNGSTGLMSYPHMANWSYVGKQGRAHIASGLKPKDLVGIPWMVAFALRADGWYLRSDIIWAKGVSFLQDYAGSCMPESVRDRPTKGHEYVFLLSKSADYYWDAEAVKEIQHGDGRKRGHVTTVSRAIATDRMDGGQKWQDNGHRNLRTVWVINPHPYKGAHFATYPPKLVEPCIKAGTSERGCCPECGKPWERVVQRIADERPERDGSQTKAAMNGGAGGERRLGANGWNLPQSQSQTLGWRATCSCNAGEPVPCTVLDPFAGSGTTGEVAVSLGRRAVLIDLNPEYQKMQVERVMKARAPLPGLRDG